LDQVKQVVDPEDIEGNLFFYVDEEAWELCVKALADPPASDGKESEPFKNRELECSHGKLCPTVMGRVRKVSSRAMELLQDAGYGFTPLFTGDDGCGDCERRIRNDDEFGVRHRKVMASFKKVENNKSESKVWISKQWLTGICYLF
jgi:hypothetical protein